MTLGAICLLFRPQITYGAGFIGKVYSLPLTDEDNTFLIQSPTALVERAFNGEMISDANPSLFKRSNVVLKVFKWEVST